MIDPPDDRPGSHLEFFLKIQHVYGQKMIDPRRMTDQDLTMNFFKDSNAHGQKMIDPPEWQTRISLRIFFKDSTCVWSKDDWPPSMTNQDLP